MAAHLVPLRFSVSKTAGNSSPLRTATRLFHSIATPSKRLTPHSTFHSRLPCIPACRSTLTAAPLLVRHLATTTSPPNPFSTTTQTYDTLVIGAGPGGLTAVACMLDNGSPTVAWCDPHFLAGRWGERYGEVPSNTKVSLFLDFVKASPFLSSLVAEAERPNAYTRLEEFQQDKGCTIRYAADLVVFLAEQVRLKRGDRVCMVNALVGGLAREGGDGAWSVSVTGATGPVVMRANKVVLATGSEPVVPSDATLPALDLDTALTPTALARHLSSPAHTSTRLAVVGSSHSAILALKNITETVPDRPVTHFFRHDLRFAEYKKGYILYDNTGLKGIAAEWARNTYPSLEQVKKVRLPRNTDDERQVYAKELAGGTEDVEAVYAVGFKPIPRPEVSVDGRVVEALKYDNLSGRFDQPGLFGCGIAFPERVTDPEGNVEHAVGMFKFMRFLKRVTPEWV